jgi:sorbitol-specific phosphotransferase system component IIBC
VFFFRFFLREGKSFVCFVKPCEAALVQEEEEEENKRGASDGGKAEGTERSNRRRNGSRSSTNLGRLGGGIGETVSTVLRGQNGRYCCPE